AAPAGSRRWSGPRRPVEKGRPTPSERASPALPSTVPSPTRLLVLAPVVVVARARGLVGPRDVVEHEGDLLGRGLHRAGRVDRVGVDAGDRRDATLRELHGEEVLRGAVASRVGPEELEDAFDDLVVAQRASEQRRRLVDALAELDRLEGPAASRQARALLASGANGVDERQALDRVLAAEARLGGLALDVLAIGLEVEVYGFRHARTVAAWGRSGNH